MSRIRLIHWKQEEAIERADQLRALGHQVDAEPLPTTGAMKALREELPDAFVIDLSRLPSHGRALGMSIRQQKPTRGIPVVFVDGAAEKVALTRAALGDAMFTTWQKIGGDLRRAIARPPADPIVPRSESGPYSRTPLAKKLGIRPHSTLNILAGPPGFENLLDSLPEGVTITRDSRATCDLALWFVTRRADLERRVAAVSRLLREGGGLWMIWPKQAAGAKTDLNGNVVREVGLAHGLVDYKVCAVDATWSGLKFARRAAPAGTRKANPARRRR
jgi:hypothetical protein